LRVDRHLYRVGLSIRLPRGGKLLDRIVRGRAWIPVLGLLLVGIVGMRVEVLKLGSSVGTEMQQASQLQSANAVMLKQVSALSNNGRIEQLAEKRGMVMPGPLDMHFVQASGAVNVNRAIADIREPSPATFLAGVQTERAKDPASEDAAAARSAVGVLGGGTISSAATTSSTSTSPAQATTTPPVTPPVTAATTGVSGASPAADSGAPTTQTSPSSTTGVVTGTGSSTAAATGSGAPDAAGATNNVPPVTSTASNGASSLAG
jgi:cell division protein FtsL